LIVGISINPTVAVLNSNDDTTPPEVELYYEVCEDLITFTAICTDDSGIDRVEFTLNGGLVCITEWEPYVWSVEIEYVENSIVCAVAYDYAGNNGSDCIDFRSHNVENNEIELQNNNEEIITLVSGVAHMDWIEQRGPFRGEVYFYSCSWCSGIDLHGLRFSNGAIETYRLYNLDDVHIPRYIGFTERIMGIAFGNIEWS